MVILHFACIENSGTNGVCVIVPQHVQAQGCSAETALINVNGIKVAESEKQLPYSFPFDIRQLDRPFDRPDLVVFHECYRPQYLQIARNLEKNGIPYIIAPHGELRAEAQKKKHLKKAAANFLLFNRFIDHAAAIQCLSENEANATFFGSRKFVGTNGIFIPEMIKESFRNDSVEFIYIGRYEWYVKGLDLLFDAIKSKEAFLRDHQCHFSLYGPDVYGRFAAVSAMVAERKIEDLVCLRHEILGDAKKSALLDADIFIQTSRHEGMPVGILEAMSYALPCLVTEGTSLGTAVSDANAGWVADTTAEGIAARIVDAVSDRKRWKEYGLNGRNAVKASFSWDFVSGKTLSQYREILNKNTTD